MASAARTALRAVELSNSRPANSTSPMAMLSALVSALPAYHADLATNNFEKDLQQASQDIRDKIREIAEKKMPDLNTTNIESAMRTIEGTAKSS